MAASIRATEFVASSDVYNDTPKRVRLQGAYKARRHPVSGLAVKKEQVADWLNSLVTYVVVTSASSRPDMFIFADDAELKSAGYVKFGGVKKKPLKPSEVEAELEHRASRKPATKKLPAVTLQDIESILPAILSLDSFLLRQEQYCRDQRQCLKNTVSGGPRTRCSATMDQHIEELPL
jgi:hypothetical protein